MATDYGSDIKALDDLPDPEEIASADLNVAYAQARRLLQPDDAHAEIGDDEPCDSIDLRDYLGGSLDAGELEVLNLTVNQVLERDERVRSTSATVAMAGSGLEVDATSQGSAGPFGLVLELRDVDTAILRTA